MVHGALGNFAAPQITSGMRGSSAAPRIARRRPGVHHPARHSATSRDRWTTPRSTAPPSCTPCKARASVKTLDQPPRQYARGGPGGSSG